MAFTAVALAYMLRVSLSYAITQMVLQPHANENGTINQNSNICPLFEDEVASQNDSPIPMVSFDTTNKYDWSQQLQGLILSSFYWGYILTHVPGGIVSTKFGGKYTLLAGVIIATVFTLLTPVAVEHGMRTRYSKIRSFLRGNLNVFSKTCQFPENGMYEDSA